MHSQVNGGALSSREYQMQKCVSLIPNMSIQLHTNELLSQISPTKHLPPVLLTKRSRDRLLLPSKLFLADIILPAAGIPPGENGSVGRNNAEGGTDRLLQWLDPLPPSSLFSAMAARNRMMPNTAFCFMCHYEMGGGKKGHPKARRRRVRASMDIYVSPLSLSP